MLCEAQGRKKRGRPLEGICFEFLMTLLLTLLALLHREETHWDATPWSQTSTLILPFSPSPPFLFSASLFLPIPLCPVDTRIEYRPPTHAHRHRKDPSPILRAHSSMRSLFSGSVVPEVAILPWPPLLFSKPCNQCAALCTRMSQDAPAKTQQTFWRTAVAQSSANQVLLVSLSSYVGPFEANKVFAVWHILLGSHKAAVGSIYKVSCKKKKKKIETQYNQ